MMGVSRVPVLIFASFRLCHTFCERRCRITGTPYLGLVVRLIRGLMLAFGARFNLNRWVVIAIINTASIMAKLLPRHILGPPPKGI